MTMTIYRNDAEYLLDELKKLDLLISLFILKSRSGREGGDPFAGLYISGEEVDALLDDEPPPQEDPRLRALAGEVAELGREIELKRAKSLQEGIDLGLARLVRAFGLSDFEKEAVIICAAPELDSKYERLYAFLQDDLTRKRPTVGLIQSLLCNDPLEKMASRRYFAPTGTLLRRRILTVFSDGSGPSSSSAVGLDPGVLDYILGLDGRPGTERTAVRRDHPPEDLFSGELERRLANLVSHLRGREGSGVCLLRGPAGAGKRAAAELICREMGLVFEPIDLAALALETGNVGEGEERGFEAGLSRLFRDAILMGSAIYLEGLDRLGADLGADPKGDRLRAVLIQSLEDFPGLAFLAVRDGRHPLGAEGAARMDLFRLDVPPQDYAMRKRIWERHLVDGLGGRTDLGAGGGSAGDLAGELASKFRFTAGRIDEAFAAARSRALGEGRERPEPEDIHEGCRSTSSRGLSSLSRKIEPRYGWNDLVLPQEKMRQLGEIQVHVRHRGLVYGDWGFEAKLSLGKGLNVLFSGPSGTGKTMAAEVMAKELGIDLYKIDLSMVVSKYIGETEKNLDRIFGEAEESNAILFFDEADALFGKRSEVKDAHDRYANVETGYLLQKMEEHDGVAILATNLGKNMDDAFLRRMQFIVEFPFPEEEARLRIWRGLLPQAAPVSEDVDFDFLAKKFKIPGGNIKNVMINAAFLAADDSRVITMEHIVRAARDEFGKMGKLCTASDFGKYYHLIQTK